jgi:hypothetical protein
LSRTRRAINLEEVASATLLSSPLDPNGRGARRSNILVVIDVLTLDGPIVVVLGVLVALILIRIPVTRRLLVRLARRVGDWAMTYAKRTDEWDQDEHDLWMMERRRKLCADLRRVEHLLATDTWMSATRQRGNRIAYNRLVDDLRHTPDIYPTIFEPQILDHFDKSATEPRWRLLANDGGSGQRRTVEVLEIGWGRRRR